MSSGNFGVVSAPQSTPDPYFWTVTAMQQARPVPMPHVSVQEHQALQQHLRTTLAAGGVVQQVALPQAGWTASPTSTPARQTNLVADMTVSPYSPVLKMFMAFPGGNYIGSAFIVGKRAVLTAGHCVWDDPTKTFAKNIQYHPRFNYTSSPDGVFNAIETTTLREYTELGNGTRYAYDIGASVVDRDFPTALGTVGYALNFILPQGKLRSVGYPGQSTPQYPFNGNQMWTSLGDYHNEDDGGFGTSTPRNYAHYNDMTGGCSGGPIFTEGGTPLVVGLNSHVLLSGGQPEQPPRMFAPYFGNAVLRLIDWLEQKGGSPNKPGTGTGGGGGGGPNLKAQLQAKATELTNLIGQLPG